MNRSYSAKYNKMNRHSKEISFHLADNCLITIIELIRIRESVEVTYENFRLSILENVNNPSLRRVPEMECVIRTVQDAVNKHLYKSFGTALPTIDVDGDEMTESIMRLLESERVYLYFNPYVYHTSAVTGNRKLLAIVNNNQNH